MALAFVSPGPSGGMRAPRALQLWNRAYALTRVEIGEQLRLSSLGLSGKSRWKWENPREVLPCPRGDSLEVCWSMPGYKTWDF